MSVLRSREGMLRASTLSLLVGPTQRPYGTLIRLSGGLSGAGVGGGGGEQAHEGEPVFCVV